MFFSCIAHKYGQQTRSSLTYNQTEDVKSHVLLYQEINNMYSSKRTGLKIELNTKWPLQIYLYKMYKKSINYTMRL